MTNHKLTPCPYKGIHPGTPSSTKLVFIKGRLERRKTMNNEWRPNNFSQNPKSNSSVPKKVLRGIKVYIWIQFNIIGVCFYEYGLT